MASGGDNRFLPLDIIREILKWFPVKSILRSQFVCKAWEKLFKNRHSADEDPVLLIHAYDGYYGRPSLRLLNHKMEPVQLLRVPTMDSFRCDWRIVGSCNGILCVDLGTDQGRCPVSFLLWNPAINEVREVPQTLNDYRRSCKVGFGFSSIVNDSKIVRFYNQDLRKKREEQNFSSGHDGVQVYSARTGLWKELEFVDLEKIIIASEAVCANGVIFWVGRGSRFSLVLVSFDIATEVLTTTPMRTLSSDVDLALPSFYDPRLDLYKNKLAIYERVCFPYDDPKGSIRMWVVDEAAGESGNSLRRTETYEIEHLCVAGKKVKPLGVWQDKLVCRHEQWHLEVEGEPKNFLYLVDLTTKEWEKVHNFSSAYSGCEIFNYQKSLVSVCNTNVDEPCSGV